MLSSNQHAEIFVCILLQAVWVKICSANGMTIWHFNENTISLMFWSSYEGTFKVVVNEREFTNSI